MNASAIGHGIADRSAWRAALPGTVAGHARAPPRPQARPPHAGDGRGRAAAPRSAPRAVELARVWRRGSAELPTETDDVAELLEAAGTATLETIAVVREGYAAVSTRENAVFNLLAAFTVTFGLTRATTALIRSGKGHGILRDFVIAEKRVHHFVPGIALALAAGGTSISVRSKALDRWLALPFGAGAALSSTRRRCCSSSTTSTGPRRACCRCRCPSAAIGMLAAGALAVRLLRRGESSVGITPAPAS